MDGGSVRFENIPLGKAEVKAYSNTGDDVVKKKVIIAPAIGGKGQVILMTLPIDVLTVKPSPAPSKVVDTKPEPRNDLASGVVGIGILVGAWFFGANYLKKRGLTPKEAFTDALGELGVDTPGAPVPGSEHSGLRASAPDVVQTPLASLGDLPPASAIPAPVEPVRALPGAHLVGLAGAVAGQNIAMSPDKESMITVGRDTKCTVPLPNDSMVSRRHAVFASSGSSWDLMDEASTNGTFLNGKRIENRTTLMSGDEIQIGMARFRYEGERRKTPVAAGGAAMEA